MRNLILRWIAAYRRRDARSLAALEAAEIEIVDRFGELHRGRGRKNNELLWSEAWEQISERSSAPVCTIEQIRFIRPDVAIVYMRARYPSGITLSDGARSPAFSELNIFTVAANHDVWLIAAHSVHQQPPAGRVP